MTAGMSAPTLAERKDASAALCELVDSLLVRDGCTVHMRVITRDRDRWERFGQHIGPRDTIVDIGAGCTVTLHLHDGVAL